MGNFLPLSGRFNRVRSQQPCDRAFQARLRRSDVDSRGRVYPVGGWDVGPAMRTLQVRVAVALAMMPALLGSTAVAATIRSPAFACDAGPYAVVLPKHYPTLHVIGKHTWADRAARTDGAGASTIRRIEYVGMTAELALSAQTPNAYRLLALDVSSRRWNIGPLSVGQNPWRSVKDPALEGASHDGTLEIVGATDSALLQVRGGRIDRVSYRCPAATAAPR